MAAELLQDLKKKVERVKVVSRKGICLCAHGARGICFDY